MFLTEAQERELQSALKVARILALAMGFGGPAAYFVVYGLAVLEGHWERFFLGLADVPWQNPVVLALLVVSIGTLAGAFLLPALLGASQAHLPPLAALRTRSIISYALLEAVSIYGLVLGFVAGPSAASLSLLL